MSGRYLTDLAAVLRAAGLTVQEESGWQTRARSSGGYASGRPTHIMWHHTASSPGSDGQSDVDYCCHGSADAPLANLYLSRTGKVWVMAAGATNTNGKGGPLDNVPADSMNTYAVGIEAANTGTGEPWPDVQQTAYMTMARALGAAYSIPTAHHTSHAIWAPSRKIDPAGPSRWATSGTWDMNRVRADLDAGWPGATPAPEPEPEDDDMPNPYVLKNAKTGAAIVVESDGLRSIGGAELNYLTGKKYDVVSVPDGDEWNMALGARGT